MTRWIAFLGLLGILAADWAALHDILKASEPSLWMEYTWLLGSLPALVALGLLARREPNPRRAREG